VTSNIEKMVDGTMRSFLDDLASDTPAPGGGSVAALAGALGAALVAMVGRLTIGRKKYASVEAEMRETVDRAEALRQRLAGLIDVDSEAYNRVSAAYGLPKDTPEQKATRTQAIQIGLRAAAEIPLQVALACVEVLALAGPAAEEGNVNAASDAKVAALMAAAGFEGAAANVAINLASITDSKYREDTEKVLEELRAKASEHAKAVYQAVAKRAGLLT
jgi:formiminotetrahydrofolate cyclodeaminase